MDKIIKEFNINEYTYKLGYYLYDDKVYPGIHVYRNNRPLSGGHWGNSVVADMFFSYAFDSSSNSYYNDYVNTIKEMFTWLRQYSNIPQNIEEKYESIFLLYKLNDFNELNINT